MLRRHVAMLVSMGFSLLLGFAVSADTVDNPGPTYITLTGGYFKVRNSTFDIDPANPPFLGCVDPPDCTTVTGMSDAQGNLLFPIDTIRFPDATIPSPIGPVTVSFDPKSDGTGTVNPITGDSTASLSIRIRLTNMLLPAGCGIGDPTNGILVSVTTGSDGTLTGVGYDQATGLATEVNQSFDVPATSGCGILGPAIDAQLGLPSPPPNNETTLNVQFTPVLTGS